MAKIHWMTPEESKEFNKKHPLKTTLIFSKKQTDTSKQTGATNKTESAEREQKS